MPASSHDVSLTEGSIARTLVRLSVPIVLANVLQTAYQMTDTFWVGRLSAEAVAAVSLAFPINFLLISIGGGLPIAGSVLISQYKGRGDQQAMNHIASQTTIMVLAVSVVLSIVGYALSKPVVQMMGAAPDVLPDAVRFLRVTFIGFIFVFGFFVFQTLMRGLGVVKPPMFIVLLTVILNFVLDPFFIFGYGPVPAMGVSGAAMATVCTQAVAAVIGFSLLFRGYHGVRLQWRGLRPDFPLIYKMLRIGLPASLEQSTRALGLTVMTFLVSSFGTVVVAAYGMGMRVLGFVFIPALGLSMATSTLVGQNIGAGKPDRAARTSFIAGVLAFTALTTAGIGLFLFAKPFARFFIPESGDAIEQSANFIRVIALTFGFTGVQQVISGTLRGAGETLAAMVLAMIALWVIQFPLAYVLSRHTQLAARGIWWSFAVGNVISACVTLTWFLNSNWNQRRLIDEVKLQQQVRDELEIDEGVV